VIIIILPCSAGTVRLSGIVIDINKDGQDYHKFSFGEFAACLIPSSMIDMNRKASYSKTQQREY